MKRVIVFSAVIGICSALLFLNCVNPASGNGSDVGNPELTGQLVDGRTNSPAKDALVRIYPVYNNKIAQALGKTATNAQPVDSTRSDHNGNYTFDSLEQGIYSLDAKLIVGNDTLTMRHPAVVFVVSKFIGIDTLQPPGSIKGKVAVPAGESPRNITCYIPGTSYMAITNDTGGFRITGIPHGTYSLATMSAKFADTTIAGIKVAPNKETNAGTIRLSLNRSKNEHDVYGVFDSTKSAIAIARIEARVSGDSIPVGSPRISKLDWRPDLNGYSGFIFVPDNGIFWTVDIWVYDSLGHRIGASRVPVISRATGDIEVPKFNPFNSIPIVSLKDTVVSINDTIRLNPVISMLGDDSIVSMAWKIGDAKVFTLVSKADTVIVAPKDSGVVKCIFKVTDRFGNMVMDTVENSVVVDPPVVRLDNDTLIPTGSKLTISAKVKQQFGSVAMYTWRLQGDTVWVDSGLKNSRMITFNNAGEQVLICRARDDDGNSGTDTMKILVVTEIGGALPLNTVFSEKSSPYVVKRSLLVPSYSKLIIEPGVVVRADTNVEILVDGKLEAIGSRLKPIEFSCNSSDTTKSSWGSIVVSGSGIELKNCKIRWNIRSVVNASSNFTTMLVDSCTFFRNTLLLQWSNILISGCLFNSTNVTLGEIDHTIGFSNSNIQNNIFITTDKDYLSGLSVIGSYYDSRHTISGNQFYEGKGISTYGNSQFVIADNIIKNSVEYGISSSIGKKLKIINNIILNCAGPGIIISHNQSIIELFLTFPWMFDSSSGTCRYNTVIGNGFGQPTKIYPYNNAGIIGVGNLFAPCYIDSNSIAGNNIGVISSSWYQVKHNNIMNNIGYSFIFHANDNEDIQQVQNNWWGTTDSAHIKAKIFIMPDLPDHGRILVDPIATDSIPGAGSTLKLP